MFSKCGPDGTLSAGMLPDASNPACPPSFFDTPHKNRLVAMYSNRFLSDTSRHAFPRSALISVIGVLLLPLVLAGCSDNPVGGGGQEESPRKPSTTLQIEGTLGQQQINGAGAFVIESTGGETYLPVNLVEENLEEGLRVRATVEPIKPHLVEDRRDEIGRDLPGRKVLKTTSARLVQIRSLKVLTGGTEEAQTNQIIWEGYFFPIP